jgi:hypothetical protein
MAKMEQRRVQIIVFVNAGVLMVIHDELYGLSVPTAIIYQT